MASNMINIVDQVNAAYSVKAKTGVPAGYAKTVAKAFGYTEEQLSSVPEGAHMGLSCGNPLATANIKEGETVVDFGSGGGIDVFLAAAKVGPKGQAIGLDMTSDMIMLARKNAATKGLKPPHVAFVQAQLTETLPIESESVDCILSNCVVNLLPFDGKAHILKEAHRILKHGGRVVLDDIIAKKPLPDEIKTDLIAHVNCVAGAVTVDEYTDLVRNAGFVDILFVDTKNDLSLYYEKTGCCGAPTSEYLPQKPTYEINEWVASYQIYAVKNGTPSGNQSIALRQWWDAYPAVKSSPSSITDEELASLIRNSSATANFAVIDVRRNDHAGGHIRGSYNWAAQTFYDDLPRFFHEFRNTPQVIFYCGSSRGRGPRCAGWYQDYLNDNAGLKSTSHAYVLDGGIKNWLSKFADKDDLVDHD